MATSGAPLGNKNASRAKKWRDAISRALARRSGTVDGGLDSVAAKLVSLAIDDGDKWAIDEIGNRLDGKPAQSIVGDDEFAPVQVVGKIELVDLSTNSSAPKA
jgi:hypothetical protein